MKRPDRPATTTPFAVIIALSLFCGTSTSPTLHAKESRPSILFVNIDDLNDWNETLEGHPQAVTPNLERLANRGLTFT